MYICALRHVIREHLGLLAGVFERRGIGWNYLDLCVHPDQPAAVSQAAGLVVLGGPMSANDDLPYLRREMRLIEEALRLGKPVLGICLGAQLLARVLGARVFPNAVKEIGWYPVWWREEARTDPLFAGVQEGVVFQWHGETFDLPAGAAWLARSEACAHQAYRAGEGVYGLQFHLEADPAMIAEWIREDEACGSARELHHPVDAQAHAARMAALSETVFGRWADLVRPRA